MIAVIQRAAHASVTVDGEVCGKIEKGFLILLGVAKGDERKDADLLADKIAKLRIFCDENDKMNLSLADVNGGALVVSNFTLLANYRKGNRPDYMNSAPPDVANELYEYFKERLANNGIPVESGIFGAEMKVDLLNDGPVTIVMDSAVLRK